MLVEGITVTKSILELTIAWVLETPGCCVRHKNTANSYSALIRAFKLFFKYFYITWDFTLSRMGAWMQLWVGASLEEGLFVCLFTFKMVLDYLKIVIPFVLSRLPLLPVPLSCFFFFSLPLYHLSPPSFCVCSHSYVIPPENLPSPFLFFVLFWKSILISNEQKKCVGRKWMASLFTSPKAKF